MVNTATSGTIRNCAFILHTHLVFITKYRHRGPRLRPRWERMAQIMRDVCADFGAELAEFTGEPEHVGHEPEYRPLPVVFAVGDFLALFEHVCFGLVVGNLFWRRRLLAILGVMVGVLVVGVLVLGVAVGAG